MPHLSIRNFAVFLIMNVGTLIALTSAYAAEQTDEKITKCDNYVSDPADSNSYAAPVEDNKVARGAAIDACLAAVTIKPDFARGWYELGRAYHLAGKDLEAFHAFVKAATLDYPSAMRKIGDAYFTGTGLPPGENQNLALAIDWYKKAISKGDNFAKDALIQSKKAISASVFDETIFQNPAYMSNMYNGKILPNGDPNELHYLAYVAGVADSLGGETVFFIDQSCQGNISKSDLNSIELDVASLVSKNMMTQGLLGSRTSGMVYDKNQGERDAKTLMHTYSCESPIVKRITATIAKIGNKPITTDRIASTLPGPMGEVFGALVQALPGFGSPGADAFAIGNSKINPFGIKPLSRSALNNNISNSCTRTFGQGFCNCAVPPIQKSGLSDDQLKMLGDNFHSIGVVDQSADLLPQIMGCF